MADTPEITPEAKVSLREVTEKTVIAVCKLSDTLPKEQQQFVAPNAVSIAQAHFSEYAWFRAIYANETPVGFVMLYDNTDEPEYFLWRLMIAGPHQGKGFGRRAVEQLLDYVRTRPSARELLVSYVPKEGSPEGFYRKLGFEATGRMVGDEVEMRLEL